MQRLAAGFVQTIRAVAFCQTQDAQTAAEGLGRVGGRREHLGDDLRGLRPHRRRPVQEFSALHSAYQR